MEERADADAWLEGGRSICGVGVRIRHYVRGFRSDWEYVVVVVSELESTALLGRELLK